MPQPNVSKHLRALDRAALVRVRVDGPRRHYSVDPTALAEVEAWLAPFREIWADRLDALEDHLADQDRASPTGDAGGRASVSRRGGDELRQASTRHTRQEDTS